MLALGGKTVNEAAVALAPTMGWLLLACAACVVAIFIAYAERWRAWWLTTDDPRSIAVFRIAFTFFVICNINGMWEHFEFLYTDEGIFTSDVARQVFASKQFAGFGDGTIAEEPWGFFDWAAVGRFAAGPKYSLLFFWDSPTFFWAHLVAFELCALSLLVGFRTRTMAVLTWFLMNGILVRNALGWEGTELVFRCFLAILVFARSGHAYSVDNWLRCRKLRRAGLLSEPGKPGDGAGLAPDEEHPTGLAAIYRAIPSWPRKLLMLQLATIYITTGTLKTGKVWIDGDSLYYALNLDHFYRVPPQYLASLAGTTVFRGMTWAVKVGQTGFSLIIVGIVTRWMITEGFAPLTTVRRWVARIGFAGLIAGTAALIGVAWPVHFVPPVAMQTFVAIWVGLWVGIWLLWRRLANNPWTVTRIGPWRLREPAVIDRMWLGRWVLGRRVLLVWHMAFHAHIFTLMNVGQFQTVMLSALFVFLQGHEIATLLRDVGYRLAKWGVPFIPQSVRRGDPIIPSEDPTLPHTHRDGARIPDLWLAVGALTVLAGIVVQVRSSDDGADWRLWWLATVVALGALGWLRRKRPATPTTGRPWAYGPLGRVLVSAGLIWHLTAVATWLLPGKDCLSSFRSKARGSFTTWLRTTTTDQGWGMFAPNPPRSNVFMKVLVTDAAGEVWDLRTDVYAEENMPIPWIWNTRIRKMNRRIIGGESGGSGWYRKWYARYECRQWARNHGGEAPKKVELVRISYSIPSPEQTAERGYYTAAQRLAHAGRETVKHTERCERAVMGQLPNFIRARDGLPLLPEGVYKPHIKRKRKAWERKRNAESKRKPKG